MSVYIKQESTLHEMPPARVRGDVKELSLQSSPSAISANSSLFVLHSLQCRIKKVI